MIFQELNELIDFYRDADCEIIKLHYDYDKLVICTPDNEIKHINYKRHWKTNGEYYFEIK